MPDHTANLNLPIPLGNETVNRQFFIDLINAIDAGAISETQLAEAISEIAIALIDSFTSNDKTKAPTADALRAGLETKQNVLRLADNYLAASVLVNAAPDGSGRSYPDGVSMFKVSSSAGGWPASNGYVLTFRAGSGGYQIFYEMYTGAVQTDKTARQWTRSKRDSNAFWQDWARTLTEVDLKLADNYKAPTAAITEYPEGRSVFYVGGGTGGQGSAWAAAAGATETFGWVETVRTGSAGYQTFTEMYSGASTTDTLSNRQFKRVKRDSNSAWQPFEKIVDQDDLNAHNADYVRQPGYAATAGTGAAYTVTLSPAPAALVDGLAITIVPHADNTVADPTLKIGSLAALPIRRQSGAQFAAGSIKAGQPLSLIKVGSYFLARSAAPVGTATAAQVLAGYTFQSEAVPDGGTGMARANISSTIAVSGGGPINYGQSIDKFTIPAGASYASLLSDFYPNTAGSKTSVTNATFKLRDKNNVTVDILATSSNQNSYIVHLWFDLVSQQIYLLARINDVNFFTYSIVNMPVGFDTAGPWTFIAYGNGATASQYVNGRVIIA